MHIKSSFAGNVRSKKRRAAGLMAVAVAGAMVTSHSASASSSTYYWDNNNTAAGFGTAGGTWGLSSDWSTDSTGNTAPTATPAPTTADSVNFGTVSNALGAGAIIVNGTQSAGSLTYASGDGAIVLSGGTINLGSTATITANNASDTIYSVLGGASTSLTLNGSGVMTFVGNNTFTGQLNVQSGTLAAASLNGAASTGVFGNSYSAVVLGGSGTTGTLEYTGGNVVLNKAFTLAAGGTGALQIDSSSATISFTGFINGSGNLLKTGAGTVLLNEGQMSSSNNGTVSNYGIGLVNEFTGTTVISAGQIKLLPYFSNNLNAYVGTDGFGLQKSVYDTTYSNGSTIGLNVNGATTPWLGGLAGSVNLSGAIIGYNTVTQLLLNPQTGVTASYAGQISNGSGAMTLVKTGPGTQILTASESYTGATTLDAGVFALAGSTGSDVNSTITVNGGTLELDNSAGTFISRVSSSSTLTLGTLILNSYNGAGSQTQTVGATTFASSGQVTINNGTAGGDQTTLALGAVTRTAGAAIDFVGTGGTLGGGANSPNVTSSSWPALTNGILPWATVGETKWATTGANGIVAYSGSFSAFTGAGATSTTQSQQTGAASPSGSAIATNSLNVIADSSSNILDLGNNVVSFGNTTTTPVAILKSGSNAYTISASGAGSLRSGTAGNGTELIAQVDGGTLTISAPINTHIVNIAKGGTGTLNISGTHATTLSGNISIAGTLEFSGLSTTISGVISGSGGLTVNLNSGQVLTLSGSSNTFSGPITVLSGDLQGSTSYNVNGVSVAPGVISGAGTTITGGLNNIVLNGGAFDINYTFGRSLGADPDQFQIPGGVSGFSNTSSNGTSNSGHTFSIGNLPNSTVVWGSTYFNPSTFVLNTTTANSLFFFGQNIDLNGSTRTIAVNSTTAANGSQITGTLLDSAGTSAGLAKTGPGTLYLTAANTYGGGTTVSSGVLIASNSTGSATGTGGITVAAGTSSYGGARLGGTGTASGPVTLVASSTAKQGGLISAGETNIGVSATGKLTTGAETWNNGAAYQWKIDAPGTGGKATGSGGSGTTGTTTTWDDVSMSGLDLSTAGGANASFTISLTNIATLTGTVGQQYSWIIGQVTGGAPTLPSGVTAASTSSGVSTGNLLTQAPTGGANDIFALDTSAFTMNGVVAPSAGVFTLEFVGTGSGDNLVLDYTAAPEPGTALLLLAGVTPMVVGRRRKEKSN